MEVLRLRQGQEPKAGTKHSIFRHYDTTSNGYTAEEILLIPQIIEQGKRKQKGGKNISYTYNIDGVDYTVTTKIRGRSEDFTNFFTNRKTTVAEQGTLNTANQHVQPQQSESGAKLQKVSDIAEEKSISFYTFDIIEVLRLIEVEKNADGRIIWHKSFYNQKKKPYANKGTRLYDASSGGGVSPIIRTEESAHDGSLSVLDDIAKVQTNSETAKNNLQERESFIRLT